MRGGTPRDRSAATNAALVIPLAAALCTASRTAASACEQLGKEHRRKGSKCGAENASNKNKCAGVLYVPGLLHAGNHELLSDDQARE